MPRSNKITRRERKRADGTVAVDYLVQVRVRGRLKTKCFGSERAAAAWAAGERKKRAALGPGAPGTATYQEVSVLLRDHWLAATRRTLAKRTHQGYLRELEAVLEWWGKRRLADTEPKDIEAYVSKCREEELASATIANRLDRLSQLHKIAIRDGLVDRVCPVERPRRITRTPRLALPEKAVKALVAACETDRERAVILLAADAGLRRAEIPRLLGEDVTLAAGEHEQGWLRIAVRGEQDRPKSGKERRVPILTAGLAKALRGCWPAAGATVVGTASPVTVDRICGEVADRAKLGRRSVLHELRHRWIARLLEGGEALTSVMSLAGHASVATTMRYTHAGAVVSEAGASALQESPPNVHQRNRTKGI